MLQKLRSCQDSEENCPEVLSSCDQPEGKGLQPEEDILPGSQGGEGGRGSL